MTSAKQKADEYTMKLSKKDYPELSHDVWINPLVYKLIIKSAKEEEQKKIGVAIKELKLAIDCIITFKKKENWVLLGFELPIHNAVKILEKEQKHLGGGDGKL